MPSKMDLAAIGVSLRVERAVPTKMMKAILFICEDVAQCGGDLMELIF
ncbi:hypothetical protein DUNSADRAFT_11515 [Dunaliella salina]|uniref:Uncharacterized protein n=1 Tax=Dunaliella salina TaxID=3046 RepID=A0ABQ7H4E9_DUNSA|nr:hypothetical protein DUNSADRAFT_11515 [Dunaliella salina]|eukprot:KAF5841735.1 hypothetical protein DUNSADRAFT_11515 [Dunaliella salina]